jgi:5-methylcytosine-specific restriction endonuclease McrA
MYYPHEADHVIAEKHGGATSLENLAWACFYCNRFNGSDFASVDPASQKIVFLFHPREQRWNRHFRSMVVLSRALLPAVALQSRFYTSTMLNG